MSKVNKPADKKKVEEPKLVQEDEVEKEEIEDLPLDDIVESGGPMAPMTLQIEELVQFCYPGSILHPPATLRMFLVAEYGPLVRQHSYLTCFCTNCKILLRNQMRQGNDRAKEIIAGGHTTAAELELFPNLCKACVTHIQNELHMKGGFRGRHILRDGELNKMCEALRRDDLISVFMPVGFLTNHEADQFIHRLDFRLQYPKELTKAEMRKLLAPAMDERGTMEFHEASRLIRAFRYSRIEAFRQPNFSVVEDLKEHAERMKKRREVPSISKLLIAADKATAPDSDELSRLLHLYVYRISTAETRNSPAITNNVRLLRDTKPDVSFHWDNTFGAKPVHEAAL